MPRRFPLFAKILLWFLLNLVLLVWLFYSVVYGQFHLGPDWLLSSSASDRIDSLSYVILSDLALNPPSKWTAALKRYDTMYHNEARFLVFSPDGPPIGRGNNPVAGRISSPIDTAPRSAPPDARRSPV